jgi:hypothetical protein
MKTQRTNRSKAPQETGASTVKPTPEGAKKIPAEFRCLEGMTPAQALLQIVRPAMFPKATGNSKAEAECDVAVAGYLSGIPGVDFGAIGIAVPEWARRASNLYWKATGLALHKPFSEWTPEEAGKLFGAMEQGKRQGQPQNDVPQGMQKASDALFKQIKTEMDDDTPEVAHKFHGGRMKAPKVADKTSNPALRTQIFLFIAMGWQQVEKLRGQVDLWQWLTKKDEAGKQMVSEWNYSDPMREMREVCQRIGLRFKSRPGKPPRSG